MRDSTTLHHRLNATRAAIGIGIVFVSLIANSPRATAVEYDTTIIGLNTEADIEFTPEIALTRISLMFLYGPEVTHPFRFRGGIGYFPGHPFAFTAGVEVPVFERLNRARAKFLGLYLTGDVSLELQDGAGFGANVGAHALIPLHDLGGITLGGGITESLQPFARIALVSGVYPLVVSRQE